jgi:hypothetical protein
MSYNCVTVEFQLCATQHSLLTILRLSGDRPTQTYGVANAIQETFGTVFHSFLKTDLRDSDYWFILCT